MTESLAMSGAPGEEPLGERITAELPALRMYVRRLLGSSARGAEMEDLVQDVVARALRYRASFEPERPLGAWLRGVALRTFLDHRARNERMPAELHGEGGAAKDCGTASYEQRESIERALARLSAIERTIVLRFHARGESIKEIAVSLAIPEGTIKSHLHRARRKLAERSP